MIPPVAGLIVAAALAVLAVIVLIWQQRRLRTLCVQVREAEYRLRMLAQIAPPLTHAATESTSQTCEQIVQRFGSVVKANLVLCFVASDDHLVLGAKDDATNAGEFLRVGDAPQGLSILTWCARNAGAGIVGPASAQLPADLGVTDVGALERAQESAPVIGSRDRVWALCLPLLQKQSQDRPSVTGAIYAERTHDSPFSAEDIRNAFTVAKLASDSLQRARFADRVKESADIDQLTQLLTATAFRRRLRQSLNHDVALFFIDTDKFKLWNDTFGHFVGDTLLKRLAEIFRDVAATGGFAGRNGGDEFYIALLDRTKDDAIAVAEQLRERVECVDLMEGVDGVPQPRIPVTISIGVAHFPVDVLPTTDAPADKLLETADARMYDAKREGRNRVAYSLARPLGTRSH